ncbi:MAG: hypothetical protein AB8H86_29360 [Polyangiales bacterium]
MSSLLILGCGGATLAPAPQNDAPVSYQPCTLEAGTLEVPVGEHFALAASEGACLLIDESREGTFVSVVGLMNDEEGFELLRDDLRGFLRASGIVGTPRFTGRDEATLLAQTTETHSLVTTPPGLPERAGFALTAELPGALVLFIGLGDSPSEAAKLRRVLDTVRLRAPE